MKDLTRNSVEVILDPATGQAIVEVAGRVLALPGPFKSKEEVEEAAREVIDALRPPGLTLVR